MPFLRGGVGIFGLIFLSHFLTKMRSFCVHQKGNFLNFSKLTLLLSLVHFWYPLWPVKHKRAFFLRHPVMYCRVNKHRLNYTEVSLSFLCLLLSHFATPRHDTATRFTQVCQPMRRLSRGQQPMRSRALTWRNYPDDGRGWSAFLAHN